MRVYTVSFENVTVSAAQDFFALTPADDKPIKILGVYVSNVGGSADAGDAQEELYRLILRRGYTAIGSGGSTPTPIPVNSTDGAAGFTAHTNDTTVANTGTTKDVHADGMNVRIPYQLIFPPELRPQVSQADTTIVFRLLSTPADSVAMSGTIYVGEEG